MGCPRSAVARSKLESARNARSKVCRQAVMAPVEHCENASVLSARACCAESRALSLLSGVSSFVAPEKSPRSYALNAAANNRSFADVSTNTGGTGVNGAAGADTGTGD